MIEVGSVVLAKAGKEKGELFVVVDIDENYAYIANGKRLRAAKPKKKSFKHLKQIDVSPLSREDVQETNERVNARIRKFLIEIRRENV